MSSGEEVSTRKPRLSFMDQLTYVCYEKKFLELYFLTGKWFVDDIPTMTLSCLV